MSLLNPSTASRAQTPGPRVDHPDPGHSSPHPSTARRHAGAGLATAALSMMSGAAVWASAGVDLDGAAETRTVHEILPDIATSSTALTATFALWLLGMTLYAATAPALARLDGASRLPSIAAGLIGLGAPMAASAYAAFLVLTNVLASAPGTDPTLANAVGYYATCADWVATVPMAGLVPAFVALSGRDSWAPRWMVGLAVVVLVASAATVVALLTGSGLTTFGFVIVPTGMVLTLSVGIVLWRRA